MYSAGNIGDIREPDEPNGTAINVRWGGCL